MYRKTNSFKRVVCRIAYLWACIYEFLTRQISLQNIAKKKSLRHHFGARIVTSAVSYIIYLIKVRQNTRGSR